MTLHDLINELCLMDGAFKQYEVRTRFGTIMDGVDYVVSVCRSVVKKDIIQLRYIWEGW